MTSPRQEGYRTPTIEDYDEHEKRRNQLENDLSQSQLQMPGGVLSLFSETRDHLNLTKSLEKMVWKERLRHFTWTFFTMTMATGGIANVIHAVPFRFSGIDTIGTIFFLFNLLLFLINVVLISFRFHVFPATFGASLSHPTESLFVPAAVVSFGTVLINISQYGLNNVGPWLNTAVLVLFWIDVALAIISSTGIYLVIWSTQTFTIHQMTPIWIFPAYPMLIIGPHAAILSATLDQPRALEIIIGGFTVQGVGFLVSLTIYAAFIYRLMTQKLPMESTRPGMFVSVGPSAFTAGALINLAINTEKALPADFMGNGPLVSMILRVVASWAALWLWGLAIWFFIVSVGAHWTCVRDGDLNFAMTWYSFIFPNTALVTATFAVGIAFESNTIQIIGCVMTCILIAAWFFVFGMMIRAIIHKQILWPQKGEDKDEGGFRAADLKGNKVRSYSEGFIPTPITSPV
ncbi:hypothetical protein MMC32_005607 [Xylographa parallela]|nr:hypothetical protein [Xylographa parallela]